MPQVKEIRELGAFIRSMSGVINKATARALMRTANAATNQAKRNARDNFTGTSENPKTGALVNAIFAGFEMKSGGKAIAEAFVGVKSKKGNRGTRPYGRIHEYGGTIKPVKANYLWIPLFGPKTRFPGVYQFHNLSPRDFLEGMKKGGPALHFWILNARGGSGKVAGVQYVSTSQPTQSKRVVATLGGPKITRARGPKIKIKLQTIPLFALKTMVQMPARPYVRPAVEQEFKKFKGYLDEELAKGQKQPKGGSVPPNKKG